MALEKLLSRRETAEILGLSPRTLERLAVVGGGPRYIAVGGACRYRPSDIEAYLDARTIAHTAQRAGLEEGPEPQKRRRGRPRKMELTPEVENLVLAAKATELNRLRQSHLINADEAFPSEPLALTGKE